MQEVHMQVGRHHGRPFLRRGRFAVGVLAATATMTAATIGGATAQADEASTTLVEPSATGTGITAETDSDRYHMVIEPDGQRDDHLVVVLGGSNVAASGYSDFTAHAAELGYAAVNLSYPNGGTIGSACQPTQAADSCFGRARGEIVFGADVPDPNGETYSSDEASVDAANSISGRLIALIDHLAVEDSFWDGFLIDDEDSPYTATHRGPVRLDHEKLILTGHSQGGGHAAFLAMRAQVERVGLLSSPDDTAQSGTAPWIAGTSATPLDRYWGIRHESEGPYGQHVAQVWSELGGVGVGAGDDTSEVVVGDGSGDPSGSHRLVLTGDQGSALANHASTAYDGSYLAGVPDAWTYVLTGGGESGSGDESPDSASQDLQVTVPEAAPGELVWSIDGSNDLVDLGTAVEDESGDYFAATGSINPVSVTDTRRGSPAWSISAQVSDFTAGEESFSGKYLGWNPSRLDSGGGAKAGDPVKSGYVSGDGLSVSSTLGYAPSGHPHGSARLGAALDLRIPVDVSNGTYHADLTLTALG